MCAGSLAALAQLTNTSYVSMSVVVNVFLEAVPLLAGIAMVLAKLTGCDKTSGICYHVMMWSFFLLCAVVLIGIIWCGVLMVRSGGVENWQLLMAKYEHSDSSFFTWLYNTTIDALFTMCGWFGISYGALNLVIYIIFEIGALAAFCCCHHCGGAWQWIAGAAGVLLSLGVLSPNFVILRCYL